MEEIGGGQKGHNREDERSGRQSQYHRVVQREVPMALNPEANAGQELGCVVPATPTISP